MSLLVLNAHQSKRFFFQQVQYTKKMASSGEILLASSPDNLLITAYNASSGVILAHYTGSQSRRNGIALAGNTLIAVSHISYSPLPSSSIRLYNWWSSTPLHNLPLPEPVAPLAATPDGLYLFSGGISGYIHVLSLPQGHLLRSFPAHSSAVSSCIVKYDDALLISGGDEGSICVFPLIHLLDSNVNLPVDALYCFSAHDLSVTAIAIGCNGSNLVSCSLDCTCKFWSLEHGVSLIRTVSFPCMLWCIALDPTLSNFYVGGSDGRVYAGVMKVDARQSNTEVVALTPAHNGAVTSMTMINEGLNVVSASESGNVWIWDVEQRKVVRVVGNGTESVSDILVAKRVRDGNRCGEMSFGGGGGSELGYSYRELRRPVKELGELEESLNVVVEDRRRAIGILEGAIETYQRLLGLVLKEAKGGGTGNNNNNGATGEE